MYVCMCACDYSLSWSGLLFWFKLTVFIFPQRGWPSGAARANVEIQKPLKQKTLQTIADGYFNIRINKTESLHTIAKSYFNVEISNQGNLQHVVFSF